MPEIRSYGTIVFRREGETILFLLLKNAKWGHWDFPKGHPDPGEDEMQAALRETREESGLTTLRIVPGFRESIRYHVEIKGDRAEKGMKEAVYFLAESNSPQEVKLSHEHTESAWLPLEKAHSAIRFANQRDLLARAAGFLEGLRA